MDYNFKKQATSKVDSLGTHYDYESIMHYGKTAFAKTRGLVTIKTKDPSKQDVIGRRTGFSAIDVIQMNRLYNCGKHDYNLSANSTYTRALVKHLSL